MLCEKPAALNVRQLEELLEAANRQDRLFMEAMKPPFFPLYQRLRAHLAVDPIGSVGFVRAGHADSTLEPDYPLHFIELGGGGIMGIGPYEAFLALDWLGALKRVHTLGRRNAAGVDSFAVIHTEHERGYGAAPYRPRPAKPWRCHAFGPARIRDDSRQLVEPGARYHPVS